jgi:hypothetical protein
MIIIVDFVVDFVAFVVDFNAQSVSFCYYIFFFFDVATFNFDGIFFSAF